MEDPQRILILGIGNLLMGDEGVGVHAAGILERRFAGSDVTVVDGGTGGFHLLSFFHDYDPIILIDATMDGNPPGTVRRTEPRYSRDFPRSLTAHDIGLRDLIETAELTAGLPRIHLVTVSIESITTGSTSLSPKIQESLAKVVEEVWEILTFEKQLA